jgi:TPP-dependent pyruvate/acetoin dehydrogenase alpha subunit
MILNTARALQAYRALSGSRLAEQAITDLARAGSIPGHHSGLGHETIGVAVGFALSREDCVLPSHRSGMMLTHARGGLSLREAVLASFGRAPGFYGPHPDRPRALPPIGLVGSALPMAVGVALADRRRQRHAVTVAFFGDGAANEGAVHEALNLAAARRAPVVFVLENNGLAISTPVTAATAAAALVDRAAGYGMPGIAVDGQHFEAIHDAAAGALERAREGQGPTLLELRMQRWEPHAHGLPDLRPAAEIEQARARDGVAAFRAALAMRGLATPADLDAIDRESRAEVEAAVAEGLRLGLDLTEEPSPYDEATAYALAYAT